MYYQIQFNPSIVGIIPLIRKGRRGEWSNRLEDFPEPIRKLFFMSDKCNRINRTKLVDVDISELRFYLDELSAAGLIYVQKSNPNRIEFSDFILENLERDLPVEILRHQVDNANRVSIYTVLDRIEHLEGVISEMERHMEAMDTEIAQFDW